MVAYSPHSDAISGLDDIRVERRSVDRFPLSGVRDHDKINAGNEYIKGNAAMTTCKKDQVVNEDHRRRDRITYISINIFHRTENIKPCNPFAKILVFKPRPRSPAHPSTNITARAASIYPIRVSFTCL